MTRKTLVTGGAGFIGSHLVDALVARGDEVVVLDDLSGGRKEFLQGHIGAKKIDFIKASVLDEKALNEAAGGCDVVYHLAASVDVRESNTNPKLVYDTNVTGAFNALEACRKAGAKKFVLTSSATIYGEVDVLPTPENYSPMKPISLYAATKLCDEAMLSSHASTYGFEGVAFRFANVIGPRSTHGVIRDFIAKLRKDPKRLEILGDGKQSKSYFHVADCVKGLVHDMPVKAGEYDAFNLGSVDTITVTQIADAVCKAMGLDKVEYSYTGGDRGWKGDLPKYWITIEKARKLGWKPSMNSAQAVEATAEALVKEA